MKYLPHLLAVAVCLSATVAVANNNGNKSTPAVKKIAKAPVPHCQVPCGIYADQMRFEMMLEDTKTIAKAITNIEDIASSMANEAPTGKSINQVSRWVTNKESHATNTQMIIAEYFLAQRIKADNEKYTEQLKASHAVIVAAMKCKQDADPATAKKLEAAILDLYRAYEGKEPKFHEDEKK